MEHKDPLESNESRSSKTLAEPYKALIGPIQTPPPKVKIDVVCFTRKDLDQIIESVFQVQTQKRRLLSFREKLKVITPNIYHSRFYMEYYNFCQQCEDHFATAGATRPNQIPFATSFLWHRINICWQQYKQKLKRESLFPISWDKFKAFLHKALGDSQAFVDSY